MDMQLMELTSPFVVLALRSAAARQLQGTATQHVFEVERTVGHVQIALGI